MKKNLFIILLSALLLFGFSHHSFSEEEETSYTPFFSFKKTENYSSYRLLPLFGYEKDIEKDKKDIDVLWPLSSYHREKEKIGLRVLPFLYYKKDMENEWMRRKYLYVLPFYISSQKDDLKSQVFFPFYGKFKGWFGRDELDIYMFPLFTKSIKGDEKSYNVLWPIAQKGSGTGRKSFRVWPLYGMDKVEGKHDKVFSLWPIYNRQKYYGIDGEMEKERMLILPFYGYLKSKTRKVDMFMFPLYIGEKRFDREYTRRDIVWPLISYARGEDRSITQFFPLFRIDRKPDTVHRFYLWPIIWANDITKGNTDETTRILFPLYYDKTSRTAKKEEITEEMVTKFWPLLSIRKDSVRTQVRSLELLPFDEKGKFGEAFYRNIGAIFTLWEYEKEADDKSLSFSIMKGLFGYERDAENKRYKLFYIPVYNKKIEAVQ